MVETIVVVTFVGGLIALPLVEWQVMGQWPPPQLSLLEAPQGARLGPDGMGPRL